MAIGIRPPTHERLGRLESLAIGDRGHGIGALLALAAAIDGLSRRVGRATAWLSVAMIATGAYNAVVRFLGRYAGWNLSSNLYLELQWYLFSLLFLLGAAHALESGAHVRVDVIYSRLGPRARALVDLLGTLLLLIPFCLFSLWACWPSVRNSWAIREASPDPGGLIRYPIRAVVLVGFALLLLQAISELIKAIARVRGVEVELDRGRRG